MENQKWLNTMRVYDEYEKRFAQARINKEFYITTEPEDKAKIFADVKRMLSYDDKLVPKIQNVEEIRRDSVDGCDVIQLRYTTWDSFYSAATLFMPQGDEKLPLSFVFCGHGKYGRLTPSYVSMAMRLAKCGMAVVLPDNIGQGDRTPQGHWNVVVPFACGLTLQGMILMESVALIRHMLKHPRIDSTRVGACGNSGGGTLCLLLAALAPELTVLSASGYPSDFPYILSKERAHCACNLLPGCAYGPEMWEILSCFAPKPLLIEQGTNDHLIPYDLFMRTARKTEHVYLQMGAKDNFKYQTTTSAHPWVNVDRQVISEFLAKHMGLTAPPKYDDEDSKLINLSEEWHVPLPEDSLDTDSLAQILTGKEVAPDITLDKIFTPLRDGKALLADDVVPDVGRGDVMRILSQMECALTKKENK